MKRYELRLEALEVHEDVYVSCAEDIYRFAVDVLKANTYPQERAWVIGTDAKGKIIGYEEVSKGDIMGTALSPRMVFTPALLMNAAGVFVIHNHPSGDPTPSGEDVKLTMRFDEAGEILGVRLMDSIVVGESYVSIMAKISRRGCKASP